MTTTGQHTSPRSLVLFMICSLIIHGLLLSVPLPVGTRRPPSRENRLFAVELLPQLQIPDTLDQPPAPLPPSPQSIEPIPAPGRTEPQKTTSNPQKPDTPFSMQREATVSLNHMSDAEFKYASYIGHLRTKINAVWNYPEAARSEGLEGIVTIRFSIARTGRLTGLAVTDSSQQRILDDEALRTIRSAAPFLPFPTDFSIDKLNVLASFEYEYSER